MRDAQATSALTPTPTPTTNPNPNPNPNPNQAVLADLSRAGMPSGLAKVPAAGHRRVVSSSRVD
eukprot:scaffold59787_cov70-Phaeocystis_antarctica.AAC.1